MRVYRRTELLWVALIIVSVAAHGYKTDETPPSELYVLRAIELAVTITFDIEIALRMIAYFPYWRDFIANSRNVFDLFLAVSSSIIQIPAIASDPAYPWLTVFQLLRWYRVVLAFPRMKPLLVSCPNMLCTDNLATPLWQSCWPHQHDHLYAHDESACCTIR